MTANPAINTLLDKLYHPGLKAIDLSLDRIERFLARIGDPQKKLPPVIHVAGTNGKGSLIANLQAIFEAGGYTVHRYISPHLVRFNERVVVAGQEIEDAYLEQLLKRILVEIEHQPMTFFESVTAAAFMAFAEHKADVVLLETGMGGRLDATNVVEPILTAITPVALDHCHALGNTVSAIAGEKAGIIKKNVPCVVGRQEKEAMDVIAARAKALNVPLYRLGAEWDTQGGVYCSSTRKMTFAPGLFGAHQYDNAATAIACIDQLPQFNFTDAKIAEGLTNAVWPGRLQRLGNLSPHIELWLDGGHNPQGGEALAAWLKEQRKEIHLVCGMVKGKDTAGYLAPIVPYIASLQAIAIPDESTSQTAEEIAHAAAGLIAVDASPSIENALQTIAMRAKTPAIAMICGSLYLAGYVLGMNERKRYAA